MTALKRCRLANQRGLAGTFCLTTTLMATDPSTCVCLCVADRLLPLHLTKTLTTPVTLKMTNSCCCVSNSHKDTCITSSSTHDTFQHHSCTAPCPNRQVQTCSHT